MENIIESSQERGDFWFCGFRILLFFVNDVVLLVLSFGDLQLICSQIQCREMGINTSIFEAMILSKQWVENTLKVGDGLLYLVELHMSGGSVEMERLNGAQSAEHEAKLDFCIFTFLSQLCLCGYETK